MSRMSEQESRTAGGERGREGERERGDSRSSESAHTHTQYTG